MKKSLILALLIWAFLVVYAQMYAQEQNSSLFSRDAKPEMVYLPDRWGDNPGGSDPGETPIGDAVVPLVAFGIGYLLLVRRNNRRV